MRAFLIALAALLSILMLTARSDARVSDTKMFCWVPDAEFPVACDDDDD